MKSLIPILLTSLAWSIGIALAVLANQWNKRKQQTLDELRWLQSQEEIAKAAAVAARITHDARHPSHPGHFEVSDEDCFLLAAKAGIILDSTNSLETMREYILGRKAL